MQGASLSIAEAEGLGHFRDLPALPVLPSFPRERLDAEHFLDQPRLIPVVVPEAPRVIAPNVPLVKPIEENGQVVLDTTAMVYDRVLAYYDVLTKKESNERRLFSRHDAARQPKASHCLPCGLIELTLHPRPLGLGVSAGTRRSSASDISSNAASRMTGGGPLSAPRSNAASTRSTLR